MNNQGPIAEPDLRTILDQERDTSYSGFNCVQVGTIASFSAAKMTATVALVLARAVYNQAPINGVIPTTPAIVRYPILVDVPVFMAYGGSAYLTMPVSAGDNCIVLFNDRDLDPWFTNGTTGAPPNSSRMHSLADGIAIVGIRPAVNPLGNVPSDGSHIGFGNASGTLKAALDALFTALTSWVNTDSTTPNTTTITAINAAKAKVDAILQ